MFFANITVSKHEFGSEICYNFNSNIQLKISVLSASLYANIKDASNKANETKDLLVRKLLLSGLQIIKLVTIIRMLIKGT